MNNYFVDCRCGKLNFIYRFVGSILKKLSQIEADNINLGAELLDEKLPDIHEEVDSGIAIISELIEKLTEERTKFYSDNKLESLEDPTAKK